MKKAKFLVDYCFEAGSFEDDGGGNLSGRFWFETELTEKEFEELYQVWFDNDSELNSWDSDWNDHNSLFDRINSNARYVINKIHKERYPESPDPLDVLWEISNETEDAF